ncbi:hypothetical protein SteCoe_19370 [Stentor coeruleus]|uniref:Uncharacterized protein n=1 Tax=Stentor coeruleus TaxID=5963 RepID=A0A1R2BUP3_9CILI|nr:hypothetical protein SteCoe_19370 [Stentor coeruleus]
MNNSEQSLRSQLSTGKEDATNIRNTSQTFLKTENHWSMLSGHIGNIIIPSFSEGNLNKKPNTLVPFSSQKQSTPQNMSQNSNKSQLKVDNAINYLILRDIGCTREDAITFTSRKRPDRISFINNLPQTLRKDFKINYIKSRCLQSKPKEIDYNFESISEAYTNFMKKKHVTYEEFINYCEKKAKKTETKLQKLHLAKPDDTNAQENPPQEIKNLKTLKNLKIIEPDGTKHEYSTPLDITSPQNFSLSVKGRKTTLNLTQCEKNELKTQTPKIQSKPKTLKKLTNTMESISFEVPIKNISGYTYNSPKTHETKTQISNKDNQGYKSDSTLPDLHHGFSVESSKHHYKKFSSIPIYEINKQNLTCSDDDSDDVDFLKLVHEEKKLIDMIRLQKYRYAQKRGEENAKFLQKNQIRKRQKETKDQNDKKNKFEKKMEKIKKAKEIKDKILIKKLSERKTNKKKNIDKELTMGDIHIQSY